MPNRVFFAALAANVVVLASGCVELGFSLIVRSQMFNKPRDGQEAVRHLIYQSFPLTAGIVNAALILAAAVFTLIGLISPMRGWLKVGGYAVALCGLFTLCIGVVIWLGTLKIKDAFYPVYVAQDPSVQQLIQTSVLSTPCKPRQANRYTDKLPQFTCFGYFNQTMPAFVTDTICPSPAAAALVRGCGVAISSFANVFVDNIFTAVFGMVGTCQTLREREGAVSRAPRANACLGLDAVLILAIACLLKDRKERERYRHIDEKSGFR